MCLVTKLSKFTLSVCISHLIIFAIVSGSAVDFGVWHTLAADSELATFPAVCLSYHFSLVTFRVQVLSADHASCVQSSHTAMVHLTLVCLLIIVGYVLCQTVEV